MGAVWFFRVCRSGAPSGRRIHSCSRGFINELISAEGFIAVHVGSLGHTSGVHSSSRGFTLARLGVVGFAWVKFGAPRGLRVRSGVRGFTLGVTGILTFREGLLGRG